MLSENVLLQAYLPQTQTPGDIQTGLDRIKEMALREMNELERFSPEVNEVNAILLAARSRVRAEQLSMTPEAFYAQYKPKFMAEPDPAEDKSDAPVGDLTELEVDGVMRPTRNSKGHVIHPSIEGVRNFWRWFGQSNAVDTAGRPLVVYHGTASEFYTFSQGRGGFFFTDDREAAQAYADHNEDGDGDPRIVDAYLSIKNSLVLNRDWYDENVLEENGDTNWEAVDMAVVHAEATGHDGLILRGFPDFSGMTLEPGSLFGRRLVREYDQYIAFRPGQIKSAIGNRGTFDDNNPNILYQSAWHGSPYHFEQFSLDHLGQGEGAQAYGWGLYFAGKESVAQWYRKELAGKLNDASVLNVIEHQSGAHADSAAHKMVIAMSKNNYLNTQDLKAIGVEPEDFGFDDVDDEVSVRALFRHHFGACDWHTVEMNGTQHTLYLFTDGSALVDDGEELKALQGPQGQLYEAQIPDDNVMLLWDKPLNEQSSEIKAALMALDWLDVCVFSEYTGQQLYENQVRDFMTFEGKSRTDARREVSLALNAAGIAGIKYLDGSSRADGEGTYNYVVFDDTAIQILRTYYQNQASPQGRYIPQERAIVLMSGANLSTFLHEAGHYFFDTDIELAGQILRKNKMAAGADMACLTEGEQDIVNDVSTLLRWHGVRGDIHAQLAAWEAMPAQAQRICHERTAESFERYLMEGRAPAHALKPYFETCKRWLIDVYTSIKDFIDGNDEKKISAHPEAGSLTDEVRHVFDRMLAPKDDGPDESIFQDFLDIANDLPIRHAPKEKMKQSMTI